MTRSRIVMTIFVYPVDRLILFDSTRLDGELPLRTKRALRLTEHSRFARY